MNVSLTAELEGKVQAFVEKGLYGNQSEVVRAGLRLLLEQEQEREARLEALRRDVGVGPQQILDGSTSEVTAEELKARGHPGPAEKAQA